ncbi:YraN family protein [Cognatishimia sp. SS12]|uniref:YraN family protein n=1 Tax=Cognatishimia sp. SS12 TaxID=2979465 RepID=UPI00232D919A|nr:YraN family protein [Cognatishimia sp. SS12]MDC0739015.1 YraN family protein [Cognatishimia sp. SS12]
MASSEKRRRGKLAYLSGLAAEGQVRADYLAQGYSFQAERWRGGGAEIDLIFRKDALLVFVEVKRAATFARAAESLSAGQRSRIMRAAEVFAAQETAGSLCDMRFDVALVDALGTTQILENAFF